MKYVSLFGLLCSIGSTFHLISLSEAQHIICDNQLINVNGDWIGVSRDLDG